jgi:hypothetical protein
MTIKSGDIKLVASKVMADVPEGGGGPTAIVLQDGASNAIFPDISELDRAIGRVNMRQVHMHVQTPNADTFMGANFIIAEPPADPRVTVTAFQAPGAFDTRAATKLRLEAYLAPGPLYNGYLFGSHLAGQMTLLILQRENTELPVIGATLVIKKHIGLGTEFTQKVRVTQASGEVRTFEDERGEFKRLVVRLSLSDQLQQDFPGFDALRINPTFAQQAARTTLYETVVADAARYYGCKPLAAPISMGNLIIQADGIYTPLVPSAQIETPIADARTNQVTAGYVATGGVITQTLNTPWHTAQQLFLGGAILPGSATFEVGAITLIERDRVLYNGTAQVGQLDIDNGVASLATNLFGTGGLSVKVVYTPAAAPQFVSQSIGIPITIESRSLTYVITLDPPPARASLSIAYMVAGKWYVLRDDGTGGVRGADSSYGVGNLNFLTGTLMLTLGALPDVGSAIIVQYLDDVAVGKYPVAALLAGGRLHYAFTLPHPIKPGSLQISWSDGAAKSVTDNAAGGFTGAGMGVVRYDGSAIALSPTVLPPVGTEFTLTYETITTAYGPFTQALVDDGSAYRFTLADSNTVGRLSFTLTVDVPARIVNGVVEYRRATVPVKDDGSGYLMVMPVGQGGDAWFVSETRIGTIDYVAGVVRVNKTFQAMAQVDTYVTSEVASGTSALRMQSSAQSLQTVAVVREAGVAGQAVVAAGYVPAAPETITPAVLCLRANTSGGLLSGVRFTFDGDRYSYTPQSSDLIKNPAPNSGAGTVVGAIQGATGLVTLNAWRAGASPTITDWSAVIAPPTSGLNSPYIASTLVFRTAAAPLRPLSLSVLGTLVDGSTFNLTANASGIISGAHVSGKVDYETGLVLLFAAPGYEFLPDTVRYNAVTYQYVPLDSSIIGMDPVSLPTDGRVPCFRDGSTVVIGNTQRTPEANASNGITIDCGRTRLSRAVLVGSDGLAIHTGYTVDLDAGTVTYTDVSGWAQPVHVEHRIEDMNLAADVQINGTMRLTQPVSHDYPVDGTYVSSAITYGDLFARVPLLFGQYTWAGLVWSDVLEGNPTVGSYNDTLAPIELTNLGAITERWAIKFRDSTNFDLIGEHVGQIASGSINTDFAPPNPNTPGYPYMRIKAIGWGGAWVNGNTLRLNTVGAMASPWLIRTIQQGPETGVNHQFSVLARGGVDRP